jgi:rare lipoprotein A
MKKLISLLIGSAILFSNVAVFADETEEEAITFSDLAENNQYYPAIMDLVDRGIVQGYDDGTFRPYDTVNRVEALKILMMYFEWDTHQEFDIEMNFSDIEDNAWYEPYLRVAYANEIVSGYDDGTFQPDSNVNLAETLKIISKAVPFSFIDKVQIEIDPAPDVPADSWYAGYAQYALEEGAVYLNAEGNLAADQNVTRGQLADILYRFEYDDQFSGQVYYGNATYYADMFEGRNTASGEVFEQALYTAAHLTLPFGTYVRVTHQNTGETAIVKVNDRGPYSDHAIIDLTSTAFDAIGALGSGVIPVEVEIIYPEE